MVVKLASLRVIGRRRLSNVISWFSTLAFLIQEFGVGNEIGGHQLLCETPDDLIMAARCKTRPLEVYTG